MIPTTDGGYIAVGEIDAQNSGIIYGLMWPNDERTAFLLKADADGNITSINPGFTSVTAVYKGHTYTSSLLVVRP